MKPYDKKQSLWGIRGIIVGVIIAATYDMAQYGLQVFWHTSNLPEPLVTETIFATKIVALAIAIGVGVLVWKQFGRSSENNDDKNNH